MPSLQPASLLNDLRSGKFRAYMPYVLGLIALFAILPHFQLFWRSNDDVAMSLIADGGGQVMTPGPHLTLTNIAWGYLVYGVHLLGTAHAYATVTYLALAASYLTLLSVFVRRDVSHWAVATLLLVVYLPTLVYAQHTLVAGYLAFAGIVLLCHSAETGSLRGGWLACLLLVLSSLVRWDETAFVVLVAVPFCLKYLTIAWNSGLRRRWLWMLGTACGAGLAFLVLDFLTFGLGEWHEFAATYGYVMALSDFKLGPYLLAHPALLVNSGYSPLDIHLFSTWFYCDTAVFTPERIGPLLDQVPLWQRLIHNAHNYLVIPDLLQTEELAILLYGLVAIGIFQPRRLQLAASVAVLVVLMFVLVMLGRPLIVRVYLPAATALLMFAALELRIKRAYLCIALVAALLAINLPHLVKMHEENVAQQEKSARVRERTCEWPADALVITWGSGYDYTLNYLPFGGDGVCHLNNYSLGEFSLAPFALEHLHKYTGGKDLVPALLAGQGFDFIAAPDDLGMLQRYMQDHYGAQLVIEREHSRVGMRVSHVRVVVPAPSPAPVKPVKP